MSNKKKIYRVTVLQDTANKRQGAYERTYTFTNKRETLIKFNEFKKVKSCDVYVDLVNYKNRNLVRTLAITSSGFVEFDNIKEI